MQLKNGRNPIALNPTGSPGLWLPSIARRNPTIWLTMKMRSKAVKPFVAPVVDAEGAGEGVDGKNPPKA